MNQTAIATLAVFIALAILVGCSEKTASSSPGSSGPANSVQSFEARGVIRSLPGGGHSLVIRHDEIPGYMPQMTMELTVHDTNEMRGLQRDDEITFRLVATEDSHWIENIRKIGHTIEPQPTATNPPALPNAALSLGDLLPDAELMTETGGKVKFSDFRGRAVALTFIFTRCPLPDFCPRMGHQFSKARELLLQNTAAPTNWQFLSISFDPDFDKPLILASYAQAYRGQNPDRWLFAVAPSATLTQLAPQVDFIFSRDGTGFSHNLRTVVLDTEGRIAAVFKGNEWTADQLVVALLRAAH